VLGVGDLHVENFGTWRDSEGRLIWGINDFDEACRLPYTVDLVRLATSAYMAIDVGGLQISKALAVTTILEGYTEALKTGGKPFVLAEHHSALREAAVERLKDPSKFWERLHAFKDARIAPPSSTLKAMMKMLPERRLNIRIIHRVAGTGSLGRRRYVALADFRGGSVAREAKELTVSAWRWARSPKPGRRIWYEELLTRSRRCPDPFVRVRGRWIIRRLAPDCSRIELSSLPEEHDACRLLHCMGWETANIHLGSEPAGILLKDLSRRDPGWLSSAATRMMRSTLKDWQDWKIATTAASQPAQPKKRR
jgi:hypothetical protein